MLKTKEANKQTQIASPKQAKQLLQLLSPQLLSPFHYSLARRHVRRTSLSGSFSRTTRTEA
jgi:hypothetical protein